MKISKKIGTLTLALAASVVLVACYDKFDVDSYKPVFTISGFTAVDEIQSDNIVATWNFDDGYNENVSGEASTNKATTVVNGFKGNAINMNASSKAYVTYADNSMLTEAESFTISFWVNPSFVDVNADNGIDGIIGLFNMANTTGFWGNIDWFIENGSNPDAAKIQLHVVDTRGEAWFAAEGYKGLFDNWSNHTLTYNAATAKFTYYINGATAKTADAPWTGKIQFANSGPLVFGAVHFQTIPSSTSSHGSEPWASYLTGTMDEIRVYNTALTTEEVNALVVLQGKGK